MTETMQRPAELGGEVAATDLRTLLDGGGTLSLIDVRTPGEFAAGHIDGAVNIPLDQLKSVAEELTDPTLGTMVVVCQAGGRAASACQILSEAGHANPVLLKGGMNSWSAIGAPTNELPGRWALERQVRLVAGSLVLLGILASLRWPRARFLSAAIGGGLVFSASTNTCGMGSVLAKLPYNRGSSRQIGEALARLKG